MFVGMGIVECEGKVLLCKRNEAMPHGGLWEFPMTSVEDEESVEEAVEQWVFEATGLKMLNAQVLPSFECKMFPNCAFFPVKAAVKTSKIHVFGYDDCKLLNYNKLKRFKMLFPSVIYIKQNKKLDRFC